MCMHAYLGIVQSDPTAPRCWRACMTMFLCILRSPSIGIFTCREDVSGSNDRNTERVRKCHKPHLHTYKAHGKMLCRSGIMYMVVSNDLEVVQRILKMCGRWETRNDAKYAVRNKDHLDQTKDLVFPTVFYRHFLSSIFHTSSSSFGPLRNTLSLSYT